MKNNHNGFIKIDRQILEWEHFKDHKTYKLFTVLLILAAYEDTTTKDGTKLKRGQLITSIRSLAKICGLSVTETRTRILTLISTHEIAQQTSAKNTIITVLKYEKYQNHSTQNNTQNNTKNSTIEEDNTTYYLLRNNKEIGGGFADASPAERHKVTRADFNSDEEYEAWRNQ